MVDRTKKFKSIKFDNSKLSHQSPDPISADNQTIEAIITNKGYPLEIHNVFTKDGYLLRLYRIPGKKNETKYKQKVRPAIFLQHGLFDSSDCWVCNKEENCYAFILANKGFDIWMGNSRGNKHSNFAPNCIEFWSFSFEEMAKYDLPAQLDFITKTNKSNEKIIYIGYSMGTTILLSGLCDNFEYFNSRIKLFILMAPLANLSNVNSTMVNLMNNLEIDKYLKTIQKYELFNETSDSIAKDLLLNKYFSFIFYNLLNLIDRNSKENNDADSLIRYFSYYPSGSSYKCFNHLIQILRKKRFCKYDYGLYANMELYKLPYPPDYGLTNIKDFKIAIIVGQDDQLSTIKDAEFLIKNLRNVVYYKEISRMGHLSFLCGNKISWFNEIVDLIIKESQTFFNEDNNIFEENKDGSKSHLLSKDIVVENGINKNVMVAECKTEENIN